MPGMSLGRIGAMKRMNTARPVNGCLNGSIGIQALAPPQTAVGAAANVFAYLQPDGL